METAYEQLSPADQRKIMHRLKTMETPAMLAALDEGIHSAATEPMIPISEVKKKLIKLWASK